MSIAPVYLKTNRSALVLGGFSLSGVPITVKGKTFMFEAMDADSTLGNPIPIDVAVQRWMTDGAVASTQGHENREIFFNVKVTARTSAELAAGEAALAKLSGEPTTLVWTPPEGAVAAPSTVFEVWTWHLEPQFNVAREMSLARMYGVRMTAKPWARSLAITTSPAPAVPGSPTITPIDNCSVITGWTGNPNTPTVVGGTSIRETMAVTGGAGSLLIMSLFRTGSVTGLGTTPYIMLDMVTTGGGLLSMSVQFDSRTATKVAQIGTVSYWQDPTGATSFTTLGVTAGVQATHGSGNCTLTISDVSKTDTIGGVGSRKQLTRHLDVGGSIKTNGSLQIASPSATQLGTVLVYTCPDNGGGYTPPMRTYRTSGNAVTPDSTCVSGNHEAFVTTAVSAGTITYTIPAGQLAEGTYAVVARFIFGAAATITTTVSVVATSSQSVTGKATQIAAVPKWGVLGVLTLPGVALPTESQVATVVTISGVATTGTHTLDEIYLLDITRGAYTLLITPSSTTQMWIDASDFDPIRNRPAIYVGTVSDRSDAQAAAGAVTLLSIGDHDLDPDGSMVLTVTDGVDNANVTGTFYHRWHTHAGD